MYQYPFLELSSYTGMPFRLKSAKNISQQSPPLLRKARTRTSYYIIRSQLHVMARMQTPRISRQPQRFRDDMNSTARSRPHWNVPYDIRELKIEPPEDRYGLELQPDNHENSEFSWGNWFDKTRYLAISASVKTLRTLYTHRSQKWKQPAQSSQYVDSHLTLKSSRAGYPCSSSQLYSVICWLH